MGSTPVEDLTFRSTLNGMMSSTTSMEFRRRTFSIGSSVPNIGTYICETCGTLQDFELEDEFAECEVCLNERTKWKVARIGEFQEA